MTAAVSDAIRQQMVDDFNSLYRPGSWVRYWTGTRQDPAKYGQTRGKAELLSDHTPVVWVTTHSACIALTHVDVIPDQPDDVEDDSVDLPEPGRAAERVGGCITAFGDGILDVLDGHPLYARDLASLCQAGTDVEQLREKLLNEREARAFTQRNSQIPRPSNHKPLTKSYAIDQITDIEHLRRVAHLMWEAFSAAHKQHGHSFRALTEGDCEQCLGVINGDRDTGCTEYQEWQRLVSRGFGGV